MSKSRITKIGALIVLAISLLIWGVGYLKGKNFFKHEDLYYAIYPDVNGLSVSNPVMINGYKVGQVVGIEFIQDTIDKSDLKKNLVTKDKPDTIKIQDTTDRFRVSFLVEQKYKIRKGSVAQIYSMDIMGTRAIRILVGNEKGFCKEKDTLKSATEGGLKEQVNMEIAPLKKKAESLISSLDSAIIIVREIFNKKTQENLRNTFANIKTTVENLERSTFTLDTIMTSEKSKLAKIFSNVESITANLKNNNDKITAIITNFSNISDSLAKADIASTLDKADKALGQFNETLNSINNGQGTIAQLLHNDTLYYNIENASYHLSRLMRDLHENPKRYLHFSVFDVGKTVYQKEKEDKKPRKKKKEDGKLEDKIKTDSAKVK